MSTLRRYLLDTNILSDVIRNPQGLVSQRIATLGEANICTSIVVAAALRFGAVKSQSENLQHRVPLVLSCLDILPLAPPVDKYYANLRYQLNLRGTPIGPNGLLIAAQVLSEGLILVSANTREFSRVPELSLENWLA